MSPLKIRMNSNQVYRDTSEDKSMRNRPHKRDINVERINKEGDPNNKAANMVANQAPMGAKRMFTCQKHFETPDEDFRKKNGEAFKVDLNNGPIRPDHPFRQNFKPSLENDNIYKNYPQKMNPLNMDNSQAEHFIFQQAAPHQQAPQQQENFIKQEMLPRQENPTLAKLFEKQRQIENLKQLLLQVESKFQMEVNEVGRLQQSVSEAERDLDEAVRLMQEVKMKNIKGMRDIEAAQDSAGRNLESKALKAHAEESQLAIHDQILFSERQRLNALRAQMIYLQTELAATQSASPVDENGKSYMNFQAYGFPYKSPMTEPLKYYQHLQNRRPPYLNIEPNDNNFTYSRQFYSR